MRDLEREGGRTENTMRRVGGAATAMGAAIIAAAGGASFARIIRETASFEDAMLGLQAVSGATADQMRRLEAQARTLGATSMFSAQQAGEAQRFLAMAGFEVNEVLSATPGILNLATAASIDLGRAADIASNVLGGFRLEVDQLNRVNDVLAATAAGSNTSIEQLGDALSYAAPIAAAAGVSIEEAAAAVGTLSDAGLQASRAGTGILGFIRQLSNLTPNATAALESYGLTAEQVNIESEGLSTVLERLQKANINTADAFRIFGSEAGPAAQILANGAQRVERFTSELQNAEGAAERAALIIGSGLTGSMRGFNSMVSESVLQLGESGLAGAFESVTDTATGLLAVYNGMLDEFAEANNLTAEQAQNLERMADRLQLAGTVAGSAAAAYVAYRGAVIAATVAQVAFNRTVMANPLGLIATLAAAAVGALYHYREELGLVDRSAEQTATAIAASSAAIRDGSQAALDSSYEGLTLELEQVSLKAQEAMSNLTELTARQKFYENSHQGVSAAVASAISEEEQAMAALWERQVQLQRAQRENREAKEKLTASTASSTAETEINVRINREQSDALDDTAASTQDAARATEQFANELESLRRRLDPAYARQQDLARATATLDQGLRTGAITLDQYLHLWDEAANKFIEAGREAEDLAETVIDGSDEMTREMERFGNAVDDVFVDAFKGAFDSFEDFADRLKNAFETLMAELAWAAVKNEIKIQLGMDTSGLMSGGISQLFGGGAGGGFNLGSLGSIGSRLTSGLGSINWMGNPTGYTSGFGSQVATGGVANQGTSFLGGSTSNFSGATGLASLGAGALGSYAGTELGSSLFGRDAGSNYGAMAGGAIGTYLGGPLGAALGSTLGGLADSLFGSSEKTYDFDFLQGQHSYVFGDNTSAFGDFGLTSLTDYKLGEQQDQLKAMLQGIADFDNQIAALAVPERFDAMKEAIDGFTHSGPEDLFETRLRTMIEGGEVWAAEAVASIVDPEKMASSLLGALQLEQIGGRLGSEMSAEIQAAISDSRGDMAADLVQQTLANAQAAELLHNSVERLNVQFDVTAQGALDAAGNLSNFVGGLDNLAALQSSYYQTYFSEAERAANLQDDLTASLSALGLELPQSRDGFRELVEAQDLNTDAGQQNYAQLLQLAGAYDQLNTSISQQIEAAYQSELGRTADAEGLAWWMQQVASGAIGLEHALASIAASSEAAEYALNEAAETTRDFSALDSAIRGMRDSVRAETSELTEQYRSRRDAAVSAYQDEKEALQDRINGVSGSISEMTRIVNLLSSAVDSTQLDTLALQRARRDQSQGFLASQLAAGRITDPQALEKALSVVSRPSEALFSTFEDYARDQLTTQRIISELESNAEETLTTEEQMLRALQEESEQLDDQYRRTLEQMENQHQSEIARLQSIADRAQEQVNGIKGVDDSVKSLEDALKAFNDAASGEDGSSAGSARPPGGGDYTGLPSAGRKPRPFWDRVFAADYSGVSGADLYIQRMRAFQQSDNQSAAKNLASIIGVQIPAFANGGTHGGGWRMVGERGPELEWTPPSRIMSNSSMGNNLNTEAVRQAVEMMRGELGGYLRDIMVSTRESADTLDDWDATGLPEERDVTA